MTNCARDAEQLSEFTRDWENAPTLCASCKQESVKFDSSIESELESVVAATSRSLRVFLCHSSGDKPAVHDLYHRLLRNGIDPWLDEEKLLPGQDWQREFQARCVTVT